MNESLLLTLLDAAGRVQRRLDRALSGVRGISYSEYHLLLALSELPEGGATRVALAEAVGLTPSAVTRALKPLEKIGLVTTEKCERDARRSLAALTRAGRELLDDAHAVVRDVVAGLPAGPVDDASLGRFLQGLARA